MCSIRLWNEWRTISASADNAAISSFWNQNQERLTAIAQDWLSRMSERIPGGDSNSAQSAFEAFCLASPADGNESLRGADELWRLIAAIVMSRPRSAGTFELRSDESDQHSSGDVSSGRHGSQDAVPSNLATLMTTELRRLMEHLADTDLEVVVLAKLFGATDEALGAEMSCTRRTIQRMLKLIRSLWQDDLRSNRG